MVVGSKFPAEVERYENGDLVEAVGGIYNLSSSYDYFINGDPATAPTNNASVAFASSFSAFKNKSKNTSTFAPTQSSILNSVNVGLNKVNIPVSSAKSSKSVSKSFVKCKVNDENLIEEDYAISLNISPSHATLADVTEMLANYLELASDEIILLNTNKLPIRQSPGTDSISYWSVGKKILVLTIQDFNNYNEKKHSKEHERIRLYSNSSCSSKRSLGSSKSSKSSKKSSSSRASRRTSTSSEEELTVGQTRGRDRKSCTMSEQLSKMQSVLNNLVTIVSAKFNSSGCALFAWRSLKTKYRT